MEIEEEGESFLGFGSDAHRGADSGSEPWPHRHRGGEVQPVASEQGGTDAALSNSPLHNSTLGHSPLGLSMMLKKGWKPGQALGRDPGTLHPQSVCLSVCRSVGRLVFVCENQKAPPASSLDLAATASPVCCESVVTPGTVWTRRGRDEDAHTSDAEARQVSNTWRSHNHPDSHSPV
jgi:hypothetical protein